MTFQVSFTVTIVSFFLLLQCLTTHVHAKNWNALNKNDYAFTAFSLPRDTVAWGYAPYGGSTVGRTTETLNGQYVVDVFSTSRAFAVLLDDMRLVCYGSVAYGGGCHRSDSGHNVEDQMINIVSVSATRSAFAALNTEGKIITWGVTEEGGGSSDYIEYWNNRGNFTQLYASDTAFAAQSHEITISWGEYPASDIAHSSPAFASLDQVRYIQSNKEAFVAVNRDGTGYTWGIQSGGGDSSAVTLVDIDAIFTTDYAFAALKSDGSVITWGDSGYGGDSSGVTLTNVVAITSTARAFAALKNDGTVVTWGSAFYGGDYAAVDGTYASTTTGVTLTSIVEVFSNDLAFAAQVSDGSIITWGNTAAGGDSSATLTGYVTCKDIFSTERAFAVLGTDDTVVAWGDSSYGGDASGVTLTNIEYVYANTRAFTAVSMIDIPGGDTRIFVSWGDATYGGDFTPNRLMRSSYVYGNEMYRKKRMTAPTPSPTSLPSSIPTGQPSDQPSGQPSSEPTNGVTGVPSSEPTGEPTGEPSSAPSALAAPVLSGIFTSNFTYYCRPFHVNTSASNGKFPQVLSVVTLLLDILYCMCVLITLSIYVCVAFQRIEPNLVVSQSVGIVSATVTMSSYTALDAMALQESLTETYSIISKYANGVLTLTAKDGVSVSDPNFWTYVLSQAAYRFPNSYKPCDEYLEGYHPDWFTFQVTDRNGAMSNEFVKKMDLKTATAVVASQRSVVISRP